MRQKMTFETTLPVIVAGLYVATGIIHFTKGNMPATGLWFSYAVGNIFIVMLASK